MKQVPLEEDWGNYSDNLDIASAHEVFAGRTNDEMQQEFKKNVLERVADLRCMPLVPFQYYIFGLKQYIDSGDFGDFDKPDAASSFIGLVEKKLKAQPNYVVPMLQDLISTIQYIGDNQESFEADIDIYGNLKDKVVFIKSKMITATD